MADLTALRKLRAGRSAGPIEPVAGIRQDLPLSFAQQRLWLLDKLMPTQAPYRVRNVDRLRGRLDVEALRAALNDVVARHEALRTSFPTRDGQPVQHIAADVRLALPLTDLSGLDTAERDRALHDAVASDATAPFDLATGPLLRAGLYKVDTDEHVLVLAMHHIISDGWSMGVLFDELRASYTARHEHRPNPLPPLPIQYADYAAWQRRRLTGDALDRQLDYWRRQLHNAPPLLELPTDHPRPAVKSYQGARLTFALPADLATRLPILARDHDATLFMVLTAALAALLHRYSGQTDLCIGTPVANRVRAETEPLIGFFANTLVLRIDAGADPSVTELLGRVRDTALSAYDHQDVPFERLVQELQPDRSLRYTPLFQVNLTLQNTPESPPQLPGIEVIPMDTAVDGAKFDLWLSLKQTPEGLIGVAEYSTDLFEVATVRRMLTHLERVLTTAVTSPDLPLSRIPLLDQDERHQIIRDWNNTATRLPTDRLIHQRIADQARRTATNPAVITATQTLNYQQLIHRTNQLAQHLQALHIGHDDIVAIYLDPSTALVTALLATLTAGAAYLPLDINHPNDRTAYMLTDAKPAAVITTSDLAEQLPPTTAPTIVLDRDATAIARHPRSAPSTNQHPDNLAYVIYTSGSTGRPKAVMVTHRGIGNHMAWMLQALPLDTTDAVVQRTPLSFDPSVWEFLAPLMTGARLVLTPTNAHRDPGALLDLIQRTGVTVLQVVPSLLRVLLQEGNLSRCTTLRRVVSGGESLDGELYRQLSEISSAELINMYGPAEASIEVTSLRCTPEYAFDTVPIGRPIANVETYVLDGQLQPVPVGAAGELYLGGIALARGYLDRPALTAERFVPHHFAEHPGQRLYRTGDLARYRPDGTLEYLGRTDQQVKLRGFRIELGEIEATLRTHPAVREAVAVIREDQPGDQRLIAYVTAAQQSADASTATPALGQVEHWRGVFEELYQAPAEGIDPLEDFAGWVSGETGDALPVEQMREWVTSTANAIKALAPRRVLEIGCGTGLLALRLAAHCESYAAVDVSAAALARLQEAWRRTDAGGALRTALAPAHDLGALEHQRFDTVVLNSVVQYFPTVDYLIQVLDGAVERLLPGGSIFIGDVRNLALLEPFHAMVELGKATDELPATVLRDRVRHRVAQENELLVDPALFRALGRRYPGLTAVSIRLKRGHFHNELTRFRYDAVLAFGAVPPPSPNWLRWSPDLDVDALRSRLGQGQPEVAVLGVPNARTGFAARVAALLRTPDPAATTRHLRQALAVAPADAVDPEAVFALAEQAGYVAELRWSAGRDDGAFDLTLRRATAGQPVGGEVPEAGEPPAWSDFTNDPPAATRRHQIAVELRELAATRLPEYMVPQAVTVLPSLPFTNGKLDRNALPAPAAERLISEETYLAPRTTLEDTLATTWADVLGTGKVGVHDNFFDLGGDSIQAIQVAARISEAGHDVSPRHLFAAQTVAELARVIEDLPAVTPVDLTGGQPDVPAPFALAGVPGSVIQELLGPDSEIEDAYPLAPLQDHMLHQKLDRPRPGLYVIHGVIPMLGQVRQGPLEDALNWVVRRHPLLRTSFLWRGVPRPLQVVHRTVVPEVHTLDWRGLSTAEQDERLKVLLRDDRIRGHSPEHAPPLRIFGVQHSDDEYHLVISRDYARLDGWSSRIYMRDFFVAYDAALAGRPLDSGAVPPPPPYARFMSWLLQRPRGEDERFWRASLGQRQPRRPVTGTRRGDASGIQVRMATVDDAATRAVVEAARASRVTVNTVAVAAWALTVSARTGTDDVLFGTASSGRSALGDGIEDMVGVFLNILPLRLRIPRQRQVSDWLKELSTQLVSMRDHEHVSLRDIKRWCGWAPGELPFDSYLVYQNLPEIGTANPRVRPRRDSDQPSVWQTEFPLRIDMTHDGLLVIWFTWHSEHLDDDEAVQLRTEFIQHLRALPAGLGGPVGNLLRS